MELRPIDEQSWFKNAKCVKKDNVTGIELEEFSVNRYKLINDFQHPDGNPIVHCSPTVGIEWSDFDICDLNRMLTCQLCQKESGGDHEMELAWQGGCDCTCPKCDVQGSPIVTARCALLITRTSIGAMSYESVRMCKPCASAWDSVYGFDLQEKIHDSDFIYPQFERD